MVYIYHGRAYAPFTAEPYQWPNGPNYRRYEVGMALPRPYWIALYFIEDYTAYGLDAPAQGFEWIRYGPDVLMIDLNTGEVAHVVYGAFEESAAPQAPGDGPPAPYPPRN
jgi:hypothetical protein